MFIWLISITKPTHLYVDPTWPVSPWDYFLATASKQTNSFPLWWKMRSLYVWKKIPGIVRRDSKQNLHRDGVTLFFDEVGEKRNCHLRRRIITLTCLPKQMENISSSLNSNNLIRVSEDAVQQPITVNIYTLLSFPFAVFHGISVPPLHSAYSFLFFTLYVPRHLLLSYKSDSAQ